MDQQIYFVGSHEEVAHHAAPLQGRLAYVVADPDQVISLASKNDLAIFYSEHFDRFRNCISTLKEKGVATLYMIDGILEWRNAWENRVDEPACPWTMRPALSHKVACIGHSQKAILDSWGNGSKTELVGIPRMDSLKSEPLDCSLPNHSSTFRLMISTAKCPGFTPEQIAKTVEGLNDLKSWFEANPTVQGREVELVWRLTGELGSVLNVSNQCDDLTGGQLVESLRTVDAVITTPSTCMVEAMSLGLPVAILDYHNTPHLCPAAWSISAATHISRVVNDLCKVPEAKRVYQQHLLNTTRLPTDDATKRLIELIQRMLEIAKSQPSKRLEFRANLIADIPISATVNFDLAQLYPEFDEFQNFDTLELQTQLAHSRREISHLNREIDQLKDELGQAHEIFEQIHKHPLAGPVIRIREKLIQWMGRRRKASPSQPNSTPVNHSTTTESTASS